MSLSKFIVGLALIAGLQPLAPPAVLMAAQPNEARAGGPKEAIRWLGRMNNALSHLNYQGTFIYMEGDDIQTIRMTHMVGEAGIRERLYSLSGTQREILRNSVGVSWVLEDNRQVMEDSTNASSYFPSFDPKSVEELQKNYRMNLGNKGRFAGRQVQSVNIKPNDNYRYGYVLWLDIETGLPLKWALIGKRKSPLAQLMFTDIRLGDEVDAAELVPSRGRLEYGTVASSLPASQSLSGGGPMWVAGSLPSGFVLMEHRRLDSASNGIFEHHVYSDGFATVSIYVESYLEQEPSLQGTSRLGTTHAFSRQESDISITVIGDVPAKTVQFIGGAVRLERPPQ